MKRMAKATFLGLCLAVLAASQTQAGLIFTVEESGGNVVVNMSGSVNLNATLGIVGTATNTVGVISPETGNILIGNPVNSFLYNLNISEWTPFGTGGVTFFSSSSGDRIAMFSGPTLGVPIGYGSGSALSATGTINNASFASLGITPGTYVTTFSNSTNNISDTITVNAVPEPGSLVLVLTTGIAGLLVRRRRAC